MLDNLRKRGIQAKILIAPEIEAPALISMSEALNCGNGIAYLS